MHTFKLFLNMNNSSSSASSKPLRFFAECESLGPMSLEEYDKVATIVFYTAANEIEQMRHSLYYNGVNVVLHSDCVPEVTERDSNEWLLLKLDEEQMLTEAALSEEPVVDIAEIIKLRHVMDAIGIPFSNMWREDEYGIMKKIDGTHLEREILFMPSDRTYFFETNHWFLTKTPAPAGAIQCRRETTVDLDIKYFAIPSDWM
jgi:hypothetical protein